MKGFASLQPSETVTFSLGRTAPRLHSQDKADSHRHVWMKAKLQELGRSPAHAQACRDTNTIMVLPHPRCTARRPHIIPWYRVLKKRRWEDQTLSHVSDQSKTRGQYSQENGSPSGRTSEPLTSHPSPNLTSADHQASHFFLYSVSSYRKSKICRPKSQTSYRRLLWKGGPLTQSLLKQWSDLRRCPSVKDTAVLLQMSPLIKIPSMGQSHYFESECQKKQKPTKLKKKNIVIDMSRENTVDSDRNL